MDVAGIEEVRDEREALRAREVAAIPAWYSPWGHLAFPSLVGLALGAGALWVVRDVRWWELLSIPVVFLLSNITEWRAHKYVLHRRTRFLEVLYDRHTPVHHRVFLTGDMAMRSRREFRLVLIPAYGILVISLLTVPVGLGLWAVGLRNVGAFWVLMSTAYVVSYEWLHLAYHLPADGPVGRFPLVRMLRRHHATHHDPALMQRWNFNVTLPLWDWVMGTIAREAAERDRPLASRDSPGDPSRQQW